MGGTPVIGSRGTTPVSSGGEHFLKLFLGTGGYKSLPETFFSDHQPEGPLRNPFRCTCGPEDHLTRRTTLEPLWVYAWPRPGDPANRWPGGPTDTKDCVGRRSWRTGEPSVYSDAEDSKNSNLILINFSLSLDYSYYTSDSAPRQLKNVGSRHFFSMPDRSMIRSSTWGSSDRIDPDYDTRLTLEGSYGR